jgi:4-amino-4-deoxy-L-arabinose transferase-like glycosyltransferase
MPIAAFGSLSTTARLPRLQVVGLSLILLAGAFLRFWQLGSRPGFDWDEPVYTDIARHLAGEDLLAAKTDYTAQPEPYLYHPPFYYMVLSLWFRLFGSGIVQARQLAACSSIVLLGLLAAFLRAHIADWSLLATGMIAFDGWLVFTNRVSWIENLMMPLGVAALWLYRRASNQPATGRFAIAGAALGGVVVFKHV